MVQDRPVMCIEVECECGFGIVIKLVPFSTVLATTSSLAPSQNWDVRFDGPMWPTELRPNAWQIELNFWTYWMVWASLWWWWDFTGFNFRLTTSCQCDVWSTTSGWKWQPKAVVAISRAVTDACPTDSEFDLWSFCVCTNEFAVSVAKWFALSHRLVAAIIWCWWCQ